MIILLEPFLKARWLFNLYLNPLSLLLNPLSPLSRFDESSEDPATYAWCGEYGNGWQIKSVMILVAYLEINNVHLKKKKNTNSVFWHLWNQEKDQSSEGVLNFANYYTVLCLPLQSALWQHWTSTQSYKSQVL